MAGEKKYVEGFKLYIGFSQGTYTGNLLNGKPTGKGKFVYSFGKEYEGPFKGGVPNGKGAFRYGNGDVYSGDVKNGVCVGKGCLYYNNGDIYEGEFADDKPDGIGHYYCADGSYYRGEWKKGIRIGTGIKINVDGSAETWEYKDGKLANKNSVSIDTPQVQTALAEKTQLPPPPMKVLSIVEAVDKKLGIKSSESSKKTPATKKTTDKKTSKKEKSTETTGKKRTVKTIKYDNGGVYEGEVRNGLPDGKGKYTFSYGDVYEGDFCAGTKTGQGKYISTDGWYYEGGFADGDFDGYGVYHYTNGDVYEGEWWEDKRQGKGKYTFADGSYYTGEWKDDKNISASETVKPATKETKAAEAKKPAEKKSTAPAAPKTEYKRIEMSSGDVYEGGYANGEYHGQGTYTSRKGWVYVGAFDNGVMTDGKLTFTESGHVFEGHFENGALHGKGKAIYYVKENGKYVYDGTYEGDWVKGKCHGKGKRVYYNGNIYDGDWVDDKRDGYGKFERYTDKLQTKHFCDLVYEGQWNGDKKHGKGVEKHYIPGVNQDVTVYEGEWVNGKREGIFVWYLFYPAVGRQSSKDMQYYRNGKVVIESIPYDASIKTYEDFAAAKAKLDAAAEERKQKTAPAGTPKTDTDKLSYVSSDDEALYRKLYQMKKDNKAHTPEYARLRVRLSSRKTVDALVRRIMAPKDLRQITYEDAKFCLFLIKTYIPKSSHNDFKMRNDYENFLSKCHYRLGDSRKAAWLPALWLRVGLDGKIYSSSAIVDDEPYSESNTYYLTFGDLSDELIAKHLVEKAKRNIEVHYMPQTARIQLEKAEIHLKWAKESETHYQIEEIESQLRNLKKRLGVTTNYSIYM